MKNKTIFTAACMVTILATALLAQTPRRHDEIMKDVSAAYTQLKADLDARKSAESAAGAQKLQNLFKEVEDFWAPYETKDATQAAQNAQTAFAALSSSIKANNFQQALTTYTGVAQQCGACHSNHRIQAADQTYRIKP